MKKEAPDVASTDADARRDWLAVRGLEIEDAEISPPMAETSASMITRQEAKPLSSAPGPAGQKDSLRSLLCDLRLVMTIYPGVRHWFLFFDNIGALC